MPTTALRLSRLFGVLLALLVAAGVHGQIDTLVLNNGDMIIGEVKGLKNNIVQIETGYSDADFKIEWDKVNEIYTTTYFLVNTDDGDRINGVVRTDPTNPELVTIGTGATAFTTEIDDVVFLQSVNQSIWSRFDVLLEVGFNITKANNLRQFNSRTAVGYTAETWSGNFSFNRVSSNQDSVAATKRTDASIGFDWYLNNDWFITASAGFLQNDEQKLKLRVTPQAGIGKYFVRNNNWLLSAAAGLAYNYEAFQTDEPSRSSLEAWVGGQINLFNTGDFSTNLTALLYPSITRGPRVRSDITWDLKYDFFDDFYLKFGTTFNYDSDPTSGASTTDYVFQTTVGWEL